ncbi:hypothetical protein ACHAXA_002811 [Cyclostephanos tholiformis]|jgi:hypothetical protein|uniref:Secreted protein n=1 Tax=Cyclostephanos tholiformis TaxID=382380 RepID=A0ABD3R1G3_9STRA
MRLTIIIMLGVVVTMTSARRRDEHVDGRRVFGPRSVRTRHETMKTKRRRRRDVVVVPPMTTGTRAGKKSEHVKSEP